MYKLDMTKVLVLLVAFIAYTNYQNFIKPDIYKLQREVVSLKTNIAREVEVQQSKHTKESLKLDYTNITLDGKKLNYSKAMGQMQSHINESAKEVCEVRSVKWAQVANSKEWYDKLRMNIRLSCLPNQLLKFSNRLKSTKTIYTIENFRLRRDRKKHNLDATMQVVGFRSHDVK